MTVDEQIDLFFRKPTEAPALGTRGILYLLRREIQDTFIGRVVPEDQVIEESVHGLMSPSGMDWALGSAT